MSTALPKNKPPLFPDNEQFWYETRRAFGASGYGASEFGEVLATCARITSGDVDSWYDAWNGAAERIEKEAADQLARGHKISARDSFLRASTYYRSSEFFLHGNPHDPRIARAYRKSIGCYKSCAQLFDPPIEPVEIPYEHAAVKQMLEAKDGPELDQMIAAQMKASPVADWGITHGMYAMGAPSPRTYLVAALAYNLRNGIAEAITCPALVCNAEDDLFFKGQPEELFDHLTCPKAMLRFTESEGAGDHCQVGAHRLSLARIYDWLDQTFGT